MAVSSATLLTNQFYEWEQRGRGYSVVDFTADLEPPFIPFFGHFVNAPYVDDGKRHTLFSRLRSHFVPEHTVTIPETPTEEVTAYQDSETSPSLTIYVVTLPRNYSCSVESMRQLLTMLSLCKQTISFEVIAQATEIIIQIVCRDEVAMFIQTQLKAYAPECVVVETYHDEVLYCAERMQSTYTVDFGLREEFMRPIATFGNSSHDPYASLFATFEQLQEDDTVILQILFCGTQNAWSESIITSVTDDRGGSFFIDAPEMPNLAKEKTSHPLFSVTVRLTVFSDSIEDAKTILHHSALALMQSSDSNHNALLPLGNPEYTFEQRLCDLVMRQTHRLGMLLNAMELATIVHFPNTQLSKKIHKGRLNTKQAPVSLWNKQYNLGINEHQGQSRPVGIDITQRLKHIHILGASGMGKSTLLLNLILQDIQSGIGCCVLDPHGDLIDAISSYIPKERIKDIVLIDPSDGEFPVEFNILSAHSDLERELLASDLVALFKRFSTSWGDQLHSVLANAIMVFLYNSRQGHIGDLRKFLIEPQFRTIILKTCTDSEIVYYWEKEYPLLKTSSIGSILTRLDSFLRPKSIRNMVCQHKGLNFSTLMDSNKIILVKLSQGLIGAENSYLLGAVIIAKLQQSAMARQQQIITNRQPFFCYIDEFMHFVTPTMNTILSGARKFFLGLVVAHQDMQQLQRQDADIASSLMSNVGTRICFRLSDTDAKRMQDGFSSFSSDDLQSISIGEAIARVNTADADFNLSIAIQERPNIDNTSCIRTASRKSYSTPTEPFKHEVESVESPLPIAPLIPTEIPIATEQTTNKTNEHRYLQSFIKTMAEQHGYISHIEVPTPNGKGHIDVVLEKGNERIAVEVSISTTVEWETHNIQKCLQSGYTKIILCSNDSKKIEQLKRKVEDVCTTTEQSYISFITPDEVPTLFSTDENKAAVTTMKGYRVKMQYDKSSKNINSEDVIKRIIRGAQGTRPI